MRALFAGTTPWLCASLLLLAGAAWEQRSFIVPSDALAYHARIRAEAAAVPLNIGDWVGEDCNVPYEAVDMLQPNVMISRRFKRGGRQVWFQLVQCTDARNLESHFPPHCYGAVGYTLLSQTPRQWQVGKIPLTAMEYEFARMALDPATSIVVENFMVLPGRGIVCDMDSVSDAAGNVRRRKYGAAEFQVLFSPGTTALERSLISQEILAPYAALIADLQSGQDEGETQRREDAKSDAKKITNQ